MPPFTSTLRTRPDAIQLGSPGDPVITLRVQCPEVWDTVRVNAPADTAVAVLKQRALEVLMPDEKNTDDFVMKFEGWEVLDEQVSLTAAGAGPGSIFLVTGRRRRPVR
jgi:hypothetical protein